MFWTSIYFYLGVVVDIYARFDVIVSTFIYL